MLIRILLLFILNVVIHASDISQPLDPDEDYLVQKLIHWITTNSFPRDHQSLLLPTIAINDKLVIRKTSKMGYGVYTTKKIDVGEILVSIPNSFS